MVEIADRGERLLGVEQEIRGLIGQPRVVLEELIHKAEACQPHPVSIGNFIQHIHAAPAVHRNIAVSAGVLREHQGFFIGHAVVKAALDRDMVAVGQAGAVGEQVRVGQPVDVHRNQSAAAARVGELLVGIGGGPAVNAVFAGGDFAGSAAGIEENVPVRELRDSCLAAVARGDRAQRPCFAVVLTVKHVSLGGAVRGVPLPALALWHQPDRRHQHTLPGADAMRGAEGEAVVRDRLGKFAQLALLAPGQPVVGAPAVPDAAPADAVILAVEHVQGVVVAHNHYGVVGCGIGGGAMRDVYRVAEGLPAVGGALDENIHQAPVVPGFERIFGVSGSGFAVDDHRVLFGHDNAGDAVAAVFAVP